VGVWGALQAQQWGQGQRFRALAENIGAFYLSQNTSGDRKIMRP